MRESIVNKLATNPILWLKTAHLPENPVITVYLTE